MKWSAARPFRWTCEPAGRLIHGRLEPGIAKPTTLRHENTHAPSGRCRRVPAARHWSSGGAALAPVENLGRGVVAVRTRPPTSSWAGACWAPTRRTSPSTSIAPPPAARPCAQRGAADRAHAPRGQRGRPHAGERLLRPAHRVRPGGAGQRAFVLPAGAPVQPYLRVPLQIPPGGTTPAGEAYTYSPNDTSVGDLDGDGEYELVVKWDPSNAKDNSQDGYTGNVYLDAYTLAGTRRWRIDLGRNIRAGAHYTQFIVFDLDGDGRAEVAAQDGGRDRGRRGARDRRSRRRLAQHGRLRPGRPRVPDHLRRRHRRRAGHRALRRAARHGGRLGRHLRQPRGPLPGHRRLPRRAASQPGHGPRLLHARGAGGLELARRGAHERLDVRHRPHRHPQPVRGLAGPGQPQPHASATWTATARTRSSTARRPSTTTAPASIPPASATATRST